MQILSKPFKMPTVTSKLKNFMKRILVTGAAGFIPSHVCEQLIDKGYQVTGVDNFITGNKKNLSAILAHERFTFIEADASQPPARYLPKNSKFDQIYHLASPASPRGYYEEPIKTYQVNAFGTHYLAEFAHQQQARLFYASTSEVYGDPLEHPQKETYWGNVHIRGLRSCYDVSKRFGEMVQEVWLREHKLQVRTVRIFNTYGPRMDPQDGRVIPNFVTQALRNEPITVYGDGSQTRSFCYVDDLVSGIITVMESDKAQGNYYNLGNPDEYTMLDLATVIKDTIGSKSEIVHQPLPEDDPTRRRPDISKIKADLDWRPNTTLKEGLAKTIEYFKSVV